MTVASPYTRVLTTAVPKRGSAASAVKLSSPTQLGASGGSQSAKASAPAPSIGTTWSAISPTSQGEMSR